MISSRKVQNFIILYLDLLEMFSAFTLFFATNCDFNLRYATLNLYSFLYKEQNTLQS